MSSSETPIVARISRTRSGYMHTNRWTALGVAATLIALGAAACTDPTVAPTSTVTGANYYNDPGRRARGPGRDRAAQDHDPHLPRRGPVPAGVVVLAWP